MTKENEFTVPEGYTSSKNATGDTIIFRKIDNKVILDLKDHPSITRANGQKEYFVDNKRHRDFGPAVERSDGTAEWWDNDKLIYPLDIEERKGDRYRFWFREVISESRLGVYVDKYYKYVVKDKSSNLQAEFLMQEESSPKTFASNVNEPSIKWVLDGKTVAEIWLKDGKIHRDGGPAKTSKDSEQWFHEGVPHRIGGPAITQKNYQAWYVGGMLHNLDGPAEIINGVPTKWALCGREISQEMFNLLVKHVTNLEKNKKILDQIKSTFSIKQAVEVASSSPNPTQLWNLAVRYQEWTPQGKDRLIAVFSELLGRPKEELALEIGGPIPDIPELEEPVSETKKAETSQLSKLAKRMAAMQTSSLINKKLMPNTGIPAQSLVNFILGTAMQQSGQSQVMDLGREMKVESLKEVGLDLFDHLVKSLEKDLPKSLTAPTSVVKEEQPVQIVEEVPVSSKFRIG